MNYKKLRKTYYIHENAQLKESTGYESHNWLEAPYSSFKATLYIEASVFLVYFLQFSKVSPNFITILFILSGFVGGVLLASGDNNLIYIGVIIFFFRSILDFTDGLLARVKKQTSKLGDLLDNWGAIVGYYSFRAGLGVYLFNKYEETQYLILTLLFISLISLDVKNFFYQITGHKILTEKIKSFSLKKKAKKSNKKNSLSYLSYLKNIIRSLFDDRSRSIDFIGLLILIDTYKYEIIFVRYIFYIMIIREIVKFANSFYLIYFKEFIKKFK